VTALNVYEQVCLSMENLSLSANAPNESSLASARLSRAQNLLYNVSLLSVIIKRVKLSLHEDFLEIRMLLTLFKRRAYRIL
jgi:hypothetical protein